MRRPRTWFAARCSLLLFLVALVVQGFSATSAFAAGPRNTGTAPGGGTILDPRDPSQLPAGVLIAAIPPCHADVGNCLNIPFNISGVPTGVGAVGVRHVQVKFQLIGLQPCVPSGASIILGSYLGGTASMTAVFTTSTTEFTVDETITSGTCTGTPANAAGLLFTLQVQDPGGAGPGTVKIESVVVEDCALTPLAATTSADISVSNPPALTIALTPTNPTSGANGSIQATGGGGTPPYEFSKDGTTFQSSGLFSGLAAGGYTITVRDANGCTTSDNVTLTGGVSAADAVARR